MAVEFGNSIDETVNAQVTRLNNWLNGEGELPGIIETIPTYRSMMVVFEPELVSRKALEAHIIAKVESLLNKTEETGGRLIRVPVFYGGEFGPDLEDVAVHAGLSVADVISRHCLPRYLIYTIGFLPGFFIQVSHHQDLFGVGILDDGSD